MNTFFFPAQFYIACAQINVTGGGSGTPGPLVAIPGVYTGNVWLRACLLLIKFNFDDVPFDPPGARNFDRHLLPDSCQLHTARASRLAGFLNRPVMKGREVHSSWLRSNVSIALKPMKFKVKLTRGPFSFGSLSLLYLTIVYANDIIFSRFRQPRPQGDRKSVV